MGFRTHDEEGALDTMSLDDYLIENREATFLVRAGSDSMHDAGILEGDLLIVDRSKTPRRQDMVIVVIDGAFAIRRMLTLPPHEAKIEAVITAVIRKYT